jgi:hypothetical protein
MHRSLLLAGLAAAAVGCRAKSKAEEAGAPPGPPAGAAGQGQGAGFIGPVMGGAGADQMDQKMNGTQTGKEEMEKMRNMVGGMGPSLKEGSLQLKTDTTVTGGPWDEAAVLSGLTFAAVKKDVYISMALQMLGEAKARALVAKAMSRI